MNPTLHDQLRQWRKAHMKEEKRKQEDKKCNEKKENRYQKPPKRIEKFSTRDVLDLMNVNRQTLSRGRGGAYKQ
ncbi:hypothetical protein [Priestia megaterium]|uniref:hypothetical protein n=1 Tax=Priestia megaterium TaxID=1404 RepID=UPI002E228F40|nr:hypothetical protein [Priestia megaterium]MED4255188.1 hypothetical protein [Priestia megaterium]MED4265465.1 hypothetical protein [Priestia megaterium]MED4274789.1 hypothetical protein [Priestia megaterium]MED4314265.1 hypothetical protein [Priestia megaterium]